jgi:phosphoribosylaminoimidazole-succinocarboxamide synthase
MSGSEPIPMATVAAVQDSRLPLPLLHRGKVRDVYAVGSDRLLMVASDRVSAFDVILPDPIPSKGEVLTQITAWWLDQLEDITPHHLLSVTPEGILAAVPELAGVPRERWARRSMLVRRTEPVLVECVVRGYISGSAWKEYRESGTLAGEALPPGLRESSPFTPPLFSPATKAQEGHDENIPVGQVRELLGDEMTAELERRSRAIYQRGVEVAAERGILLADTKFEFGIDPADGRLLLIDEVLTPDSSRFWPQESYAEGRGQPSLDKQPIRDYLASLPDWNGHPPGPPLPPEVIRATTDRYRRIFRLLTGVELEAWSRTEPSSRDAHTS